MSQVDAQPERSASEEELAQLLAEADALAKAEQWDKAIAAYRKVLDFDRFYQGTEAQLQWALRMRDTDAVYKKGEAALATGQYADARQHFNKARLLYASSYKDADKQIVEAWYAEGKAALEAGKLDEALNSLRKVRELNKTHYKDTDALIVEAETKMQKGKWAARPGAASSRGCFLFGVMGLLMALALWALTACSGWVAAPPVSAPATQPPAQPPAGSAPAGSGGPASAVAPAQRNNMYKTPPPMTIDPNKSYTATIKTAKGNIVVELYPKDAPQHVNSFVYLARQGFFDNLTFHRVEPGFVIQGGDPLGTGTGGPGFTIPPEIKRTHPRGALAMARQGGPPETTPSSGSQFYITLAATPNLDGGYTSFGQVTTGMEIVDSIRIGDVIQTISIEEK